MYCIPLLALAFATASHAAPSADSLSLEKTTSNILKGAYIVEFEAGDDSSDTFYQNLTSNGIGAAQRQVFAQPGIFSGTSFHLARDSQSFVDVIGNFTQVKKISPVRIFTHGAPVPNRYENVNWEKLKKRNLNKRVVTTDNDDFSTHVMTGVDKLHKEGLDGSGIVIAEIDTGIDYTLAALGGCFGPGCKIAFGTDLVGDAYNGGNTPVPDNDPIDCNGHGTHVAGIIAAANDPYIIGVAPNATLGIYKVFGCTGGAANDVLISAFMMAHNHGVDLITSSIGGDSGWPEEPWSAAVAAIVAAGTPCMLSAGNDGEYGLYYASTASAGKDVTSVGSVDNVLTPEVSTGADYVVGGKATAFGYTPATGSFAGLSLPLYSGSRDTSVPDDGCNGYTDDLTGKLVLIRRGSCTFVQKAQSALKAGAKYVMFYNNVAGVISPVLTGADVTAAGVVTAEVGGKLIAALSTGEEVTIEFYQDDEIIITAPGKENPVSGGYMSTYSTWNPSNENTIKPVVSAPGGDILSTYLSSQGGYAVLSGTSMAAPFIAGVVALYKQAKGRDVSPLAINAALASTANPLDFNDGSTTSPYLTSVAQQGGGLVDAYHMIHAGITVTEANLAFNDTANHVRKAAFYVQNTGTTAQTFTLTHQPAANVYAFTDSNKESVAVFPPPVDTKYATAVISPSTLSIKPGEKKRVSVAVTPDASLDSTLVPFYSGFINITGGGELIHLPYGGAAAVMHDIQILESNWPTLSKAGAYSNGTTTTFKPSVKSYPTIYWNLRWATAELRLDVISVDKPNTVFAAGLKTFGSVDEFPLRWVARGLPDTYDGASWDGVLADDSTVPSGKYYLSLRVAKVFADLNRGREFEKYDTEVFIMDMS